MSVDQAPVFHIGTPWTTCRSCGARITFAKSTTGKAPFEADDAGLWTIRNGEAVYLGTPDKQPKQLELGKTPEAPELCGNSVPPAWSEALIAANFSEAA